MSHKFLFYLRKRIYLQEYGRKEILDLLARKTLKSVARATGNRIQANKWLQTLEWIYRSSGSTNQANPELNSFYFDFNTALNKYFKTHKTSINRVKMILDYLMYAVTQNDTDFVRVLNVYKETFEQRSDTEFFREFLSKIRFTVADCGHISHNNQTRAFAGNAETYDHYSSVCHECANAAIDSGERVPGSGHQELLLTEFATTITSSSDRTYIADCRHPNYTFNEQYGIWVDRGWSPYRDLIDGYHMSRSRGFTIIESSWFKRHRRAYGLVLEIQKRSGESSTAAAGRIHDVLNPSGRRGEYCYFERDGSIGEGFEIVTQPAGLDVHRVKLSAFLNQEHLKRGLRSHEGGSCGLHIHVGREFVTQAQIYRVQSFLNDIRNEGLIRKISRRYGNSYARIKHEMAKLSPVNKRSSERYEALNVTNTDTIEFRIFRGSLRYESVMAALEFVDSLLSFCMPGQTAFSDFNSIGFRRYITRKENGADTQFLRNYLSINSQTDDEQSTLLAA